ncbi:hypothetical protein ILYODFUR_023877 [Ilyodon furcidens]|uniref:Uncharacterized protein n=1 Tax=Ilyodon furcidens TaxID=33524 RepID=A0ABV0TL60_9TELE
MFFMFADVSVFIQASWASLRTEFAALKPAQLHHMLREYSAGRPCPSGWSPSAEDGEHAVRTADILESFDNHPPLILPSSTFHLELGKPIVEPALFEQLSYLQDFIGRLPHIKSQTETYAEEQVSKGTSLDSPSVTSPAHQVASPRPSPEADSDLSSPAEPGQAQGSHGDLTSCEAVLAQKLKSLQLQNTLPGAAHTSYHKSLALDPSCLLTPPNTPQGMELAELEADLREGIRQLKKGN